VNFGEDQFIQLVDVIRALGPQCQLRTLSFGMSVIKKPVITRVTEMLKVNKSLQKLEMEFAQMELADLFGLMHAVKHHL